MSYIKGLKCRECHRVYKAEAIYVCEFCFGSLEVDYDYEAIKSVLTSIRVRLSSFKGIDRHHLARVELVLDRTRRGALLVTDVSLQR